MTRRPGGWVLMALAATSCSALAQEEPAGVWRERAAAAQQALVAKFWNERSDLFELTHPTDPAERQFHYWWQAHAIDVLVDAFERSGDRDHLQRATRLWTGIKHRNGGITNDYYDDMLWMALALHRLQSHTDDAEQRRDVRALWRDVKAGWNEQQGGGIAWCKAQLDYKNTPANAPAVILGARLYRAFGDKADLQFAERVYAWLDATLVDPATGFVWDGKNRNGDGRTDKTWAFTYNQGVRIGAAVELFRATNDPRYLQDATKTFEATIARLTDARGVLKEHGKGDGGLFKGILMRYLGELIRLDPAANAKVSEFVRRQAESAWSHLEPDAEKASPLLFGADWSKAATTPVQLGVQLSGVMLFEQMARLTAAR